MWKSFEYDFAKFLSQRNGGYLAAIMKGILWVLSLVYRLLVACRNRAFDSGWLASYYPPIPVIFSVGNIVAGGTGKTPFTALIASEFVEDYRVAILSRGYRAMAEHLEKPFFLSKGEGPLYPASYSGDEPYLLAIQLPKAFVLVGADRKRAAKMAARTSVELAIIDDGMQHRWLCRDYDIVLVNAKDPLGLGYFLPRGFLRDTPHALKRASLIVLTHAEDDNDRATTMQLLRQYSEAPVVAARSMVSGIYSHKGELIPSIEGKAVAAFCGIAHPENFFATLTQLGARIVARKVLPDHGYLTSGVMEKFLLDAQHRGAEMLICTEKDCVKLKDDFTAPLLVAYVKIKLEVFEGLDVWNTFLTRIKESLQEARNR